MSRTRLNLALTSTLTLLLLLSFNPTVVEGEAWKPSVEEAFPSAEGTLTLRIYPDDFIEFNLDVTSDLGEAKIREASFNLTSTPSDGKTLYEVEGLLNLPVKPQTAEPQVKAEITLHSEVRGDRDYERWFSNLTLAIPETLNLTVSSTMANFKVERRVDIQCKVEADLRYQTLNLSKTDLTGLLKLWPILRGLLEGMVEASSGGELTFMVNLTDYRIGDDVCSLEFEVDVSGRLLRGLRNMVEAELSIPSLPGVPREGIGNLTETLPKKQMVAYLDLLDSLSEVRYSWIESGTLDFKLDLRKGESQVKARLLVAGDIDRQATESMWLLAKFLRENLAVNLTPPYDRLAVIFFDRLGYPANYRVSDLSVNLKYNPSSNKIHLSISGVKARFSHPAKILECLSIASEYIPDDRLLLALEGSSNSTTMVKVSIPGELSDLVAPPLKVEDQHRIVWRFRSLGPIERVEIAKEKNTVGVSGLRYRQIQAYVDGKLYFIQLYTNSTLISEPTVAKDFIEMKVSGRRGSTGAFNMSIPLDMVDGVIVCSVDGVYSKPKVALSEELYWIYLSYTHSGRVIRVAWGPPEFTVEPVKPKIQTGEEVAVRGAVYVRGLPLTGETVSILLDGQPVAETVLDDKGEFKFQIKIEEPGLHRLTVSYSFLTESYTSSPVEFEAAPPWYQTPTFTAVVVASILVAVAAAVALSKRKTGRPVEDSKASTVSGSRQFISVSPPSNLG